MRKRILHILLSILLVAAINALCVFIIDKLSDNEFVFSDSLINLVYWSVMILCLVQTGVLLTSHYKRLYSRFFITFTGIYAILFLILYSIVVKAQFRTWNSYKKFMGNARALEGFDLKSCFIGDHSWFLVPAALQVLMVVLLCRQQKQAASKAID